MKRRLLTLALAALTIGFLGSCSKINERIDDIDSRVDSIEQEKIASIGQQIATINSSIADLSTIRTNIQTLMDAKTAMGEDITKLKAADQTLEGKINDLKAYVDTELAKYATKDWANATFATLEQLETTEKALESLKETVDNLGDIDGTLKNLKAELSDSIANAISSLAGRINKLEEAVDELKDKVDALEHRIQSVTIIPAYIDGSVEGFGSILKIKCVVEPADAVAEITKDDIIVLISEAITKAVKFDTVAVSKLELDKTTGEINIKADISSITPVPDGKTLMAALEITIGPSNYITGFYPVYSGANVSVTTTDDGSPKIDIRSDPDSKDVVCGEIPVEGFYEESKSTTIEVEGFGTITFDATAAAKIKENASGATNILIKVEDITKTLANPVPDADVVLEVTMKAVDEAGTEVFSEDNAAGKVTIEIPVDPEVVFVKNVTLVDDDGVVIENGVDPETIKLDLEKHLLSFEVKHFSKYAVGYVKSKDFKAVTGVTLNTNSMTLSVGGTETLTATVAPDDATNKNVTWNSSNTAVATVDKDGKVKGISDGTATITVTTEDGSKTATCVVTVKAEIETIADVLATVEGGFPEDKSEGNAPVVPSNAWSRGSSGWVYEYSSALIISTQFVDGDYCYGSLTTQVTKRENCYTATISFGTLTFKMTNGILTSIEFTHDNTKPASVKYGGTYTASTFPAGATKGVFSVSDTKKVHFSQGNLWYGMSEGKNTAFWYFEKNQYSISSSWDANHVSNFYWSKTASVAYAESYNESVTSASDVFFTNATGFTVGGQTNVWRTLSHDEWKYLFEKHNYKYAQVNGKYGIVIAPDGFSGTIADSYSATTWATAEAAGLVFLPSTGYRTGGSILEVSGDTISCIYWTSTAVSDKAENAYRMFFQWNGSTLSTEFNDGNSRGWAVGIRLVTEVPAAGVSGNGTEQYNNNSNPDWFSN